MSKKPSTLGQVYLNERSVPAIVDYGEEKEGDTPQGSVNVLPMHAPENIISTHNLFQEPAKNPTLMVVFQVLNDAEQQKLLTRTQIESFLTALQRKMNTDVGVAVVPVASITVPLAPIAAPQKDPKRDALTLLTNSNKTLQNIDELLTDANVKCPNITHIIAQIRTLLNTLTPQ